MPEGLKVTGPKLEPEWNCSYGLRVLRKGYLYVYIDGGKSNSKDDKYWDCYGVSQEGRFRGPYAPEKVLGQNGPWCCKRAGHPTKASYITIRNAKWVANAYFLFSQDPLSEGQRNELAKDPGRMHKLDVKNWLATKSAEPKAGAFPVEDLPNYVLEYAPDAHGADEAPLQTEWRNRNEETADMMRVMAVAMKGLRKKHEDRALVLALPDEIGMVQEVISARNYYEGRIKEVTEETPEQVFVASAIKRIEENFKKEGKQADWDEKYAGAFDKDALDTFMEELKKKTDPLEAKRDGASNAWCALINHLEESKYAALDERYHPDEPMDCVNQSRTCADMVNGTGKLDAEKKVWGGWVESQETSRDNLLDRAITGGNVSLLAFLAKRTDGFPAVVDTFKGMYSAYDEWEKANAELVAYRRRVSQGLATAGVDPREWAVRKGEALLEQLQKFFQSLAGNIASARASIAKQTRNALIAGAFWLDVKFTPLRVQKNITDLDLDLRETAWGVGAQNKLTLVDNVPARQVYRVNAASFLGMTADPRSINIVVFEVGYVRNDAGIWVQAPGNRTPAGVLLPQGVSAEAAVTRPNYYMAARQWAVKGLRGGGVVTGFAGLSLVLNVLSINDALHTISDKTASATEQDDAMLSLLGGGIGAIGAIAEGSAGVWRLAAGEAASVRVAGMAVSVRGLAMVGGIIGSVAAAVAAVQIGFKAWNAYQAGDDDASKFLALAATSVMIGAIAGGAAVFGSAATVTIGLISIGPLGWTLLAIGAAVAGAMFLFGANRATDGPLEAWLKQCCFGTADHKYAWPEEEVDAYNKIFEIPLSVSLTHRRDFTATGKYTYRKQQTINVEVRMPRLPGKEQRYELTLHLDTADGRGEFGRRVSGTINSSTEPVQRLAQGQTLEEWRKLDAEDEAIQEAGLMDEGEWDIDADAAFYTVERTVTFGVQRGVWGVEQPNESQSPYVRQATLEVKFWPDYGNSKELVIPVGGGPGGKLSQVFVPRSS